jgi:hypothetical protein
MRLEEMLKVLALMVALRTCTIGFPTKDYPAILTEVKTRQAELRTQYDSARTVAARHAVIDTARAFVLRILTKEIFPAWYGTDWDYNGTTTEPRKGQIACGYFVTTTLEDAGFNLPRVRWAQSASEPMIKQMTKDVRRYSGTAIATVETEVIERGPGLYVVGMDDHVGFIVNSGDDVTFVHSQPGGVTCERLCTPNRCARSRYRVIGKVLTDDMMTRWLSGTNLGE